MYIKDLLNDTAREYGSESNDSLLIAPDGKSLTYYNKKNGSTSDDRYRFVTDGGEIPNNDEFVKDGHLPYANVGGWNEPSDIESVDPVPESPEEKYSEEIKKAAVLDQLVKELNDRSKIDEMLHTTLRILTESGYLSKKKINIRGRHKK